MADFNKFIPHLKKLEGGFVNHPIDKGGPTNMGVTLAVYRSHYGQDCSVNDLKDMTDREWSHIMKVGYWDRCLGDSIASQSVAEIFVDWAVNSGPSVAIRNVQQIVGTRPDGIAGQQTLAAVNDCEPESLFERIRLARMQYYRKLVELHPEKMVFLKGWLTRAKSFTYKK